MELKEGELILKDKILVGLQHVPNKVLHNLKITLFFVTPFDFFFLFHSKIANLHFSFFVSGYSLTVWCVAIVSNLLSQLNIRLGGNFICKV
jgi:hypothetical protein